MTKLCDCSKFVDDIDGVFVIVYNVGFNNLL